MNSAVIRIRADQGAAEARVREGLEVIRTQQDLPAEFPADVLAAADEAVKAPRLPDLDLTDVPFLTIDPPGAMDLDQAMHLERDGSGFVVRYAIADVAAFVRAGDPIDLEAHRRGETLYGGGTRIPLHPPALSEGGASLLPDQERPALVWTVRLDADGGQVDVRLERAMVRSRARLDYAQVQRDLDAGTATEGLVALRDIGMLRFQQEAARGGVSLPLPSQEVVVADGGWRLEYRPPVPAEGWNAQISLLTGMAAGAMMVQARVGILRTLPPAEERSLRHLRRKADSLGVPWPAETTYPDFVRTLDPEVPAQAAMLVACTSTLRGAGYVGFDGEVPAQPEHAAIASTYAHVTAPLRRLVDRYGLEVCASISAGTEVPSWVTDQLLVLPEEMATSSSRASRFEHAVVDLVEALCLEDRVGETFSGVVVESDRDDERKGKVMVTEPAVEARVTGDAPLPAGERVDVTLSDADPVQRLVRFHLP